LDYLWQYNREHKRFQKNIEEQRERDAFRRSRTLMMNSAGSLRISISIYFYVLPEHLKRNSIYCEVTIFQQVTKGKKLSSKKPYNSSRKPVPILLLSVE